jgi:hypothetical protein
MLLQYLPEVMHVAKQEEKRESKQEPMKNEQQAQSLPEHSELYEKLSADVGIATWDALAPHAERGGLFWVDQSLDLVEVGVSLAVDDASSVKAWHEAELFLPAAPQAPSEFAAFRFLIIQPFVIAAPLDLSDLIDPSQLEDDVDDADDADNEA